MASASNDGLLVLRSIDAAVTAPSRSSCTRTSATPDTSCARTEGGICGGGGVAISAAGALRSAHPLGEVGCTRATGAGVAGGAGGGPGTGARVCCRASASCGTAIRALWLGCGVRGGCVGRIATIRWTRVNLVPISAECVGLGGCTTSATIAWTRIESAKAATSTQRARRAVMRTPPLGRLVHRERNVEEINPDGRNAVDEPRSVRGLASST